MEFNIEIICVLISIGFIVSGIFRIIRHKKRVNNKFEQTYKTLTTSCQKCGSRSVKFYKRTEYKGIVQKHANEAFYVTSPKMYVKYFVQCSNCSNISFSHDEETAVQKIGNGIEDCVLSQVEISPAEIRPFVKSRVESEDKDSLEGCRGAFAILLASIWLVFILLMMINLP